MASITWIVFAAFAALWVLGAGALVMIAGLILAR
jgi:hypothetical protein